MDARRVVGLIVAVVLTIVLPPAGVFAQATGGIEGKVVDAKTGEVLVGAKVAVQETKLRATVKEDGRYSISGVAEGTYKVAATMTDYRKMTKEVEVSADKVTTVDFELEMPVIEAERIVITGTKTRHTLRDVPVEAIVLTKEEIQSANVKNVAEALNLVPGIYKVGKGVVNQGMPHGYTLMLVDGQRVYKCPGRMPELNSYPVDMIEKVEIVKGASSTLYGSDAIGGVVNIITKTASPKPTFSGSAGLGNYGTQVYNIGHRNTVGKFGYSLNYARHLSDGKDPDLDQYKHNDVTADLRYRICEHQSVFVKPSYYHQNIIWKEPGNLQTRKKYLVNSGYKLEKGKNALNAMGSFMKVDWGDDEDFVRTYETDVNYSRRIAGQYVALAGYHYHMDKFKWGVEEHGSHGYYAQGEANWKPVTLVAGGRLEDHNLWGNHFCPEAKLLFNATDDIRLRASVGKAFHSPKAPYFFPGIKWKWGRWTKQDPDLGPVDSLNYQMGAEVRFLETAMVKGYLFRNDVDGMVGFEKTSEMKEKKMKDGTVKKMPVFILKNYKDVATQGLEVSVSNQLPYDLYGTVGYSFWDTENKETGKELTYSPKHMMKGTLLWQGPYGTSADLRVQYVSSRYTDDENTEKFDPYTLLGVGIAVDVLEYGQVFLTINNIFDTEYEEYAIMPGREFLGGLRAKF